MGRADDAGADVAGVGSAWVFVSVAGFGAAVVSARFGRLAETAWVAAALDKGGQRCYAGAVFVAFAA